MANTQSAKKAIRGSEKKRQHNLFWKRRIKSAQKNIEKLLKDGANADILKENLQVLQKLTDKAAKEKVLHKNKANRIKSRLAAKIKAAHGKTDKSEKTEKAKTTGTKSKAKSSKK